MVSADHYYRCQYLLHGRHQPPCPPVYPPLLLTLLPSSSSTFDVARRRPAINITTLTISITWSSTLNISITWSSTPCPRWRILQSCHWWIPIQDKGEMMAIIPPLSPHWNIIRWADDTTPLSTHHHPQPHNTNTPTITAITPFSFPSLPPNLYSQVIAI